MPSYIVYIIPAPPLRLPAGQGGSSYSPTPGITRKVVDADSGPAAAAAAGAAPGTKLEVVLMSAVEDYDVPSSPAPVPRDRHLDRVGD